MTSQLFDLRPDRIVTYELRENVAWLGLNRPHKRNAIDSRSSVRCRKRDARPGRGPGNGDLRPRPMFSARTRPRRAPHAGAGGGVPWLPRLARGFHRVRRGRMPAVAALHGATIGGGLELAAACHIRVADETAFFALPEGTRGIYVGEAPRCMSRGCSALREWRI